ncbi:MAG: glycoside hydrolase family 43 protein [Christensenellaceae bacterium]
MIYPANPHLEPLQLRSISDCESWKESWAHDPSLLEADGIYYAFSTDTGRNVKKGYQIRKSFDLVHWEYVGPALPVDGSLEAYAKGKGTERYGNLSKAYRWCLTKKEESPLQICTKETGEMSFWAPHCIKGADGKFWLYFCLTGYFGGSKSCIGLAKSDVPTGPYSCVDLIVCSSAGWRNPNAIDPQAFYDADGELHLVYGSYGIGLQVLDLDKNTGLRADGLTREDFDEGRCSYQQYYGTNIANGSIEGGVIKYHPNVPVYDEKTDTWTTKNYYYLMCSFGSLSTVYNMRCGRSENVHGPYVDVNGNTLCCSTDMGTGNKLLGSFRWQKSKIDYFCPGHNDMLITSKGFNVISYHCKTHAFPAPLSVPLRFRKKFTPSFLFVSQYTFNAAGWIVLNPNRYAGEQICTVTKEDFLSLSKGVFHMIRFVQNAEQTKTSVSVKVRFKPNGTFSGSVSGAWKLYGDHYIDLTIGDERYRGVVMPTWQEEENGPGLCISTLGETSGMAIVCNSAI